MKLFLLTQTKEVGYDTYDSVVVAAKSEELAKYIHPETYNKEPWTSDSGTWCSKPSQVTVELIGTALRGTKPGVILASFNAA